MQIARLMREFAFGEFATCENFDATAQLAGSHLPLLCEQLDVFQGFRAGRKLLFQLGDLFVEQLELCGV